MYLRYHIYEDGELLRKVSSRLEAEPYIQSGCDLKVMPKLKQPTDSDKFNGALELVGECLI